MPRQKSQRSPLEDLFVDPPTGAISSPPADESNDPARNGPQTNDELYDLIVETFGLRIPRKALAPDRISPFDALADAFFERTHSFLWLAPRGGAKTLMVAILNVLWSTLEPGFEALCGAATLEQSGRGYSHLRALLKQIGDKDIDFSLKRETKWRNGSKVEIVSGSESAMRGPHPVFAALDEVDDVEPATYEASRMMSTTKTLPDGRVLRARDGITSTRKARGGLMDRLVTDVEEAVVAGKKAAFDLYKWTYAEIVQNQPRCRRAPENEGRHDSQLCDCHLVQKGQQEDGSPRLFSDFCGGQLYEADGFVPLEDAHKKFLQTDRRSWKSEMQCDRASTDRNILPNFRPGRNVLKGFTPLVTGSFYGSVDYGWSNAQATLLGVLLSEEIEAKLVTGAKVKLPASSLVIYDEIYRSNTPHSEYVNMLKAKQAFWEEQGVPRTQYFFYDQQGARDANEWMRFRLPMRMLAPKRAGSVEDSTRYVQNIDELGLLFVDSRCQHLIREISGWLFGPDGLKPLKATNTSDHAVDSLRYLMWNMRVLHPSWIVSASEGQAPLPRQIGMPAASGHRYRTADPYTGGGGGEHTPVWITVEGQ